MQGCGVPSSIMNGLNIHVCTHSKQVVQLRIMYCPEITKGVLRPVAAMKGVKIIFL